MNKPIAMGNCVFATWEQLDVAFDKWAKGYFGEHVRAEAAREENECCLEVEGLEHKDFEKFSALFERFDKEGLYDPEYEFDTGVVTVQLPGEFARGILSEIYKAAGLRGIGNMQANDVGVFMMEKELDYYKVMTGQYLNTPDIEDVEKYFSSLNLGDYDLGGCEFTREDYEIILEEIVDGGLSMEEVVHEFLLGVRQALDDGLEEGLSSKSEPVTLDEAGLRSMIPIMQREGVTLAHVSAELDYRERAGVKDGASGWDDSFIDYSTEELQFIESAWSKMEAEKGAAKMEEAVLDDLIHGAENLKVEQPFEGKGQDLGER